MLRRHQEIVTNDTKKSKTNLTGFVQIAVAPTSVFPIFFQGAPGPVGDKGSVGRPGLLGKKVSVIS